MKNGVKVVKLGKENCMEIFPPIRKGLSRYNKLIISKKSGTSPKKSLILTFWSPDYGPHDSPGELACVLSLEKGNKSKG